MLVQLRPGVPLHSEAYLSQMAKPNIPLYPVPDPNKADGKPVYFVAIPIVGSPQGALAAPPGQLALDTNAGVLYVKVSGTGVNGWVQAGTGSSGSPQITQGNGAPSSPPGAPALPSIYTDRQSGVLYSWNTVSQAWM